LERSSNGKRITRHLWDILGVRRPGGPSPIEQVDLYLDALACLQTAKDRGLVVGIAGNQPAGVETQLRAVGFDADFIASSDAWRVSKPSPEFFSRTIRAAQLKASAILYIGDRLDDDIVPAHAAGMRTAFIRRGPGATSTPTVRRSTSPTSDSNHSMN
jgi:FMN phosphatase YigB (HAD superfamily)